MKIDMKALARHLRANLPRLTEKKLPKRYPQMVTTSPEEIAEWNRNVNTRQVLRRNDITGRKNITSDVKARARRTGATP